MKAALKEKAALALLVAAVSWSASRLTETLRQEGASIVQTHAQEREVDMLTARIAALEARNCKP